MDDQGKDILKDASGLGRVAASPLNIRLFFTFLDILAHEDN
jgi:hypothetical protein